jgi:hypothetical protein
MTIYPFMLGWTNLVKDLKLDTRLGIYAPTGDSGADAFLGDFEGRTIGVGPVLSYVRQVGQSLLLAELKCLPELDTDERLEGDYIWFKFGVFF